MAEQLKTHGQRAQVGGTKAPGVFNIGIGIGSPFKKAALYPTENMVKNAFLQNKFARVDPDAKSSKGENIKQPFTIITYTSLKAAASYLQEEKGKKKPRELDYIYNTNYHLVGTAEQVWNFVFEIFHGDLRGKYPQIHELGEYNTMEELIADSFTPYNILTTKSEDFATYIQLMDNKRRSETEDKKISTYPLEILVQLVKNIAEDDHFKNIPIPSKSGSSKSFDEQISDAVNNNDIIDVTSMTSLGKKAKKMSLVNYVKIDKAKAKTNYYYVEYYHTIFPVFSTTLQSYVSALNQSKLTTNQKETILATVESEQPQPELQLTTAEKLTPPSRRRVTSPVQAPPSSGFTRTITPMTPPRGQQPIGRRAIPAAPSAVPPTRPGATRPGPPLRRR